MPFSKLNWVVEMKHKNTKKNKTSITPAARLYQLSNVCSIIILGLILINGYFWATSGLGMILLILNLITGYWYDKVNAKLSSFGPDMRAADYLSGSVFLLAIIELFIKTTLLTCYKMLLFTILTIILTAVKAKRYHKWQLT